MIHKGTFSALLDANVLYGAPSRDLLLRLAEIKLFRPKWSPDIMDEWKRNLLKNRTDLTEQRIDRTIVMMNEAFPDAQIKGYEKLVDAIDLPDFDDRHIVAAAIREKTDVIITFNIKDFPRDELSTYDLEVKSPDNFVLDLIELDSERCCRAFNRQHQALTKPYKTKEELASAIEKSGYPGSSVWFQKNCV